MRKNCNVLLLVLLNYFFSITYANAGVCQDPAFSVKLKKIQVQTIPTTFKICGENDIPTIQALKSIAGDPISEIERKAKPCAFTSWSDCSTAGFIASDENLINVIVSDQQTVQSYGLTHQRLAAPLLQMRELRENCQVNGNTGQCKFGDQVFEVTILYYLGYQESIFSDGLRSNSTVIVRSHKTGETIEYDGDLLPNYIAMYGFYEGFTPYRLSPEKIIEFFKIK